ncbi:MAG: BON domain-containing protein [Candidatus Limnocylindrales bacterium]
MTDERPGHAQQAETPPNPPDVSVEEMGRELSGDQLEGHQVAYVRQSEIDDLGTMRDTAIYEGELEAGVHDDLPTEPEAENLEDLTALEMRAGETANPDIAAEEGLAWVPPIDPPVIPSEEDPQGLEVAAGFGVDSLAEPYDADHHSEAVTDTDDMEERIHEALRADSATSAMAQRIQVALRGGTVILRGEVEDLVDTDEVVAVVERVTGVTEVIDEIEVAALG